MPSESYFQCLICQSLFGTLWKVERHIKVHDNNEFVPSQASSGPCRRRGMLPIQKVTLYECFVPVVKNQIDPEFLANYSGLQANDNDTGEASKRSSNNNDSNGVFDNLADNNEDEISDELSPAAGVRRSRRSNLRTRNKIRQITQILTIPDVDGEEVGDKVNEEMNFIETLMKSIPSSGYYSDDDFIPRKTKPPGGKIGRPIGSKSKLRPTHFKKSTKRNRRTSSPIRNDFVMEDGSGDNPWKCDHCSKSFSQKNMLTLHISRDHTIPCPIPTCKLLCANFIALQLHLKFHDRAEEIQNKYEMELSKTEDKPNVEKLSKSHFYCKYCLEKQNNYTTLETHLANDHKNDSNLKCPCCDLTFENDLNEMIVHIKVFHADCLDPMNEREKRSQLYAAKDKRYKCEQCDKCFVYKAQLEKHKKSHIKLIKESDLNKPFSCPVCKKGFNYKDNLRRHFTLHLENNPFVCDFPNCKRRFNCDYNLRRHKELHYESVVKAKRVNCPICNAVFPRKDKLPRHIRMKHKPSDLTNGIPNKIRPLPPTTRVPRYPRYEDSPAPFEGASSNPPSPATPDIYSATSSPMPVLEAEELNDTHIKIEANENEIHLVDRILINPSGEAIHVTGEVLNPVEPAATIYRNNEKPPELTPEVSIGHYSDLNPMKTSLSEIIASDPVFKKFEFAKTMMLTKRYNYNKNRMYTCLKCKAVFTRAWTLELHLKSYHNTTILDETKLLRSTNREVNDGDESSQITLMCGKCAYVAEDASDLQRHMDTAPDHGKRLKCSICGLSFASKVKLDQHSKKVHLGARNFPCKFCNKSYTTVTSLNIHQTRVHNNSQKVFKKECPVCLRLICNSSMRGHLERHKQANQTAERFKCMLCHDTFSAPGPLQRHIDCVHLGKPLNKGPKGQTRSKVGLRPPGTSVRRGPKRAGDEWFLPLLEGMESTKSSSSKNATVKVDEPVDNELSILGF